MAENSRNPYSNTEIIDNDVIAGYAYKYLGKFWNKKVDGEDFLTILYSVLEVESGFNKFIKSRENETSYGLFQINWGDKTNRNNIYNNYPQFREAGLMNVPVEEMTFDQHNTLAELMSDLDFQFHFARFLMQDKEDRNLNLFSDWSAYTNNPPVNGTGPYKPLMTKYSQVSNPYKNENPASLIKFFDNYTPTGPANPPGVTRDLSQFDPANSNMFTGEPTPPEEQWKQIKQYYGKDFYDYETDKWLPNFEDTEGFKQWSLTFDNGLEGDYDLSYVDYLNNFGSINAASEKVEETFGKVTAQTGFFNPFRLSALSGPPTLADTVKIAVFERYASSAFNQGFPKSSSEALALTHLANAYTIDLMNRAVTMGLESGLALPEMIDLVSQSVASYTNNNETKSWTYRLPEFKDARIPEQNAIAKRINDKVSSVLLINDPGLTDQIKRSYTDYKIINPNTQVSIEDFAMPFIKDTRRYNRIYQQKPPQFSEEQYIGQYSSAVGGVMGLGDPNYNNAVTSSASVGATNQETQTAATFGSPGVGLGDTFRDKVSALGERIGGMFNK